MKLLLKFILGFIIVASVIIIIGYSSILYLQTITMPLEQDIPQSIEEISKQSQLDGDAQFIRYYDEVLTQSARNYAFTGDKKWEERYRSIEPELDQIIKDAINRGDKIEKEFFANVNDANLALVKMEYKSIDFVNNGQPNEATKILDSVEYWNQKKIYEQGLRDYVAKRGIQYDESFKTSTGILEKANKDSKEVINNTTQLIMVFIVLVLTTICSSGFLITKSINRISSAESKYRNLYNDSPAMYRSINTSGIILDCNIPYTKSLGYTKEEVIGKSIFDHTSETSLDVLQDSFNTWKTEGSVKNREVWMKRKDGSTFPVLLSAIALYDDSGRLIGSNTILRDITEIYNVKKKIEEEKLKRLSAIGELSARIAHDLRNPLSVIKNSLEIMKRRNQNMDSKTLEDFARLNRAVTRMTHQIDEVLDYVTPKPLTIHDSSLLEILNSTLEKIVLPSGVTITLPLNDAKIHCDPEKLEIVFANLLTNAFQAMDNKGNVTIRLENKVDHVLLEVEDNGAGIPEEIIPNIFDPLFTTRQAGTGLGLASCKSIVELHKGTITVRNNPTTFVIKFPKNNSNNAENPMAAVVNHK